MLDIRIINPIDYEEWDRLVLSNENSLIFHSSAWARVLVESYRYKPFYFTMINNGRLEVLIPLMEINSYFTGKRGVCLPFSDYCFPIISGGNQFEQLIEMILEKVKNFRWRVIEFKGLKNNHREIPKRSSFYRHSLDLTVKKKNLYSNLRKGTKSSIKKAKREGVNVEICRSMKSVENFYKLHCMTRKKHGLPPQPFSFFKNIYKYILKNEFGFVMLATYQKKYIAGAVFFHFGKTAMYKYSASNIKYRQLCANNLILWEAIKWFKENNFHFLCFGKTESANAGLLRFKRGWGTREEELFDYRYDFLKNSFCSEKEINLEIYKKVFVKLPLFILKFIGGITYRHIG